MCEKLRIFFRIQEGYTIKRKERESLNIEDA